jgi:amino acid adenylation domain-containing protein
MTNAVERRPAGPAELPARDEARAALVQQRLRGRRGRGPIIPRRAEGAQPPPSFAQERLWFMDQLAPETAAYVVPFPVRLRGPVDRAGMQAALDAVVARHESLRMRFPASPDGRPTVVVDAAVRVPLEIRSVDADAVAALLARLAATPFDLTTGPLVRAVLVRVDAQDHVLLLVVHHIVFDGWSIDVFLRDLFAAYDGTAPLGDAPTRYGDYAAWQRERYRGERAAGDLAFWREHLAGVPPLDLPTDATRPPEQSFRGAGHPVAMDGDVARGLLDLSRRHGATAYMTLLAAYQALLSRYSGQDDFAVGSTVAGRVLPELEGTVGLFANVLAMRADLSGNPTFAELLDRVRTTVLDAFAHEEGQFDQIVSELRLPRDISRSPVFQATFTLLNYTQSAAPPAALAVAPFPIENLVTRFDLELYLYEPTTTVTGFFTYNADVFHRSTIERLTRHLERVLRAVVADPDVRVGDIDLLDPDERDLVLHGWNDTTRDTGRPVTLAAMVEAQVLRTPDAVAVVFEDTALTYRELDALADRLARRLRRSGVGPGAVVAVCAQRCPELVVALLAVLKSGAAYLPLDPGYPAQRLEFMLTDAAAPVVLATAPAAEKLPTTAAEVIRLDRPQEWSGPAGGTRAGLDDTAYVIYTSGSTGRPKGVLNTHRGIHNRLDWMQRTYRLGAGDVVLQKTPTGFDVSVWEFFWPLTTGARLVLARPGGEKDAAYLRDTIAEYGVTTVHFVPSMLSVFLASEGVEECRSLRRIICSGEELPVRLVRAVAERLDCELHNLYGPTEAAIDVSSWACRPGELAGLTRVPIGRPIQNVRLYILDSSGRPVPPGLPGELHIAGVGVARGYLNRPELTEARFRPDPYGPPGDRMYATGDLARHRPDGAIEYLGRLDNQVKVRGVRIELGEIESVLREQPGVRDAAVVVREDRPGDQRLSAYVVGAGGAEPDTGRLRAALKAALPDYLVPSAYVPLPALPVTPNGKLDRRALPAPTFARAADAELTEPRDDVERAIAGVWAAVLGRESIGIDDNFFDLGGHSLLATQVVAKLRTALPAGCGRASVMDLFKNPTIRQLAALVAAPEEERGPRRLLHELTPPVPAGTRKLSVVCVPYGGGSAVVYQPLADALPPGHSLYSLAIPGHDVGLDEQHVEFGALVDACVAEILGRIDGPVAVYGHCGVGGALAVAIAVALERAGRPPVAVFAGAIFPFARPPGRLAALRSRLERLRSNKAYTNWLASLGVDLSDLEPDQVRTLIGSMRTDSESAEEFFTELMRGLPARLSAPIISVVGERDDMTLFYEERYREWHFLTDTAALVVLDEAGHYFLKHRAGELATILVGTVAAIAPSGTLAGRPAGMPRRRGESTWWWQQVSRSATAPWVDGPQPSMRRFLAVASGQLLSMAGSAMTEFAVPIWIYLHTHSLLRMALFSAVALVPGIVVLPFAGTVVDRYSRRAVMLASDVAAGVVQACFLALVLTDQLRLGHLYALLAGLSVALTFQRLAYASAVPQLVPKRYLGHANGVVQTAVGVAQFLIPVAAAGMLATIGLSGILAVDVVSYAAVVCVVALTRFPPLLAGKRREPVAVEIRTGFRYATQRRGFPAMLMFFAAFNIFLGPLFIMVQPLVLGFGTLSTVTRVAIAAALGGTAGGLLMALWGGPAHRRMRGMLSFAAVICVASLVTGLRPALAPVAAGVCGMAFGLTVMNAIYATIVQVKVPARYHGRVFAVQTLFAWCTLPIGFVLVGPFVSDAFQPLLRPDGALADTVGRVIGTGPARGIALTYLVFAVLMAAVVAVAWRYPTLRSFDRDVPDAEPDDLIGLIELRRRQEGGPDGRAVDRDQAAA